jgi:hypothetical protein
MPKSQDIHDRRLHFVYLRSKNAFGGKIFIDSKAEKFILIPILTH